MYSKGFKFIYINGKALIGEMRKKKRHDRYMRKVPIYKYNKNNLNGRVYIHTGNIEKEKSGCILFNTSDHPSRINHLFKELKVSRDIDEKIVVSDVAMNKFHSLIMSNPQRYQKHNDVYMLHYYGMIQKPSEKIEIPKLNLKEIGEINKTDKQLTPIERSSHADQIVLELHGVMAHDIKLDGDKDGK